MGKAAITDRIDYLKQGNFGDIDSVRTEPGLFEMRIGVGPGYRVYFGEFDGQVVVLILGGTKKTQTADIKKAGAALRWLHQGSGREGGQSRAGVGQRRWKNQIEKEVSHEQEIWNHC